MSQRPNVVGLILCRDYVIEEERRSVTLVRCLDRLALWEFPSPPQSFFVYTVLTDGQGELSFELSVTRLETLDDIYTRSWQSTFTDPLAKVHLRIRIRTCSFPQPGRYEVGLDVGEERVAQCVLQIAAAE